MGILEKYQMEITAKSSNPSISDGWEPSEDPGYLKKCLKHGNCTITVLRPILTDQERVKRDKAISREFTNLVNAKLREIDKKISAKEYDKDDYKDFEGLTEEELKRREKELEAQLEEAIENYTKQLLDPKTLLK